MKTSFWLNSWSLLVSLQVELIFLVCRTYKKHCKWCSIQINNNTTCFHEIFEWALVFTGIIFRPIKQNELKFTTYECKMLVWRLCFICSLYRIIAHFRYYAEFNGNLNMGHQVRFAFISKKILEITVKLSEVNLW